MADADRVFSERQEMIAEERERWKKLMQPSFVSDKKECFKAGPQSIYLMILGGTQQYMCNR